MNGQIQEIETSLPGLLRHKVIENQSAGDWPLKVQITGPLFYDASHQPCLFNASGAVVKHNSPARRTIWEIHPAYRIQREFDVSELRKPVLAVATAL